MNISQKVAYLKGLAEGMALDSKTNEGKLTLAMLDVLNDIADELEILDEDLNDMAEIVAEIEDDLEELEEEVFGEMYDDYDFDGDDLYEVTCRKCNNTLSVDMSILDDDDSSVNCPKCGEKIEFDIDFLGSDDDDDEEE